MKTIIMILVMFFSVSVMAEEYKILFNKSEKPFQAAAQPEPEPDGDCRYSLVDFQVKYVRLTQSGHTIIWNNLWIGATENPPTYNDNIVRDGFVYWMGDTKRASDKWEVCRYPI